ncbi:GntR family transcriptional regulator [Oceanobacillus sp. J11TS1]|uniref:GntR family transcriptional regulator n=1 Tax=Oceanobacillus sp. J11TS1 TaxID=2807191 RepID=UPI001B13C8A3|nr:GntR family transcriptional regulator [Oceanobacillus sp. J11TS1]GIO22023.1 GntR family transcriptional regulator [Oceanobacillus sp. J11TS1]
MSIRGDARHLYLQVIDQIKQGIDDGVYQEDEKLPSEYELSKKLGVSRATLREALRMLEEDNIVTKRHGVGTFVNAKAVFQAGIEELRSVTSMIEQSGKKPGAHYISTDVLEAGEKDKALFNQPALEHVTAIERIRTADNEPVVFCIDKIPTSYISIEKLLEKDSIFTTIEMTAGKKISYAVTNIEPVIYHERIYNILQCAPDQPLLLLKQMHYTSEDEAVLYSANYFRADKFSFHVVRKRI